MNEINLVLLGLKKIGCTLTAEIFVDKEVEVIMVGGIGLLILVLDRRGMDRFIK